MQKEKSIGITTKKTDDIADWYQQVCLKAEVADFAPVKGCMIIRPLGMAIWESIQEYFNARMKEHKVKNAYFPLFVPESFFKKEASHAEGFSPEVAWIEGSGKEGERLAVRPTSEAIMYDSYAKWIRSHRDLPLKLNQWCNIVRWETEATKLFLRSREFLWQEGHCAFATLKEADEDALTMLDEYQMLCRELLALPVIKGKKTDKEKFAGADYTCTIEAFMPDGKALQCGTTHNLGQNFAKSFEISYMGEDEKHHEPYQTSWGVSTRLIGAMIMMHGDDKGLVLPPAVAPLKAIIVPILFDDSKQAVLDACEDIRRKIRDAGLTVKVDDRQGYSPGWKFSEWEMKGVPMRVEVGPKDMEKKQVVLVRRDTGEKESVSLATLASRLPVLLEEIQANLFGRAKAHLDSNIADAGSWKDFEAAIKDKKMVRATWCGDQSCEEDIKAKTAGVSARCMPLDEQNLVGKTCAHCGKVGKNVVLFSRSY